MKNMPTGLIRRRIAGRSVTLEKSRALSNAVLFIAKPKTISVNMQRTTLNYLSISNDLFNKSNIYFHCNKVSLIQLKINNE